MSRHRCTPAVLNSHPRGLSDYSLVKEQSRSGGTHASRRSSRRHLFAKRRAELSLPSPCRSVPAAPFGAREANPIVPRPAVNRCRWENFATSSERSRGPHITGATFAWQPVVTGVADFATCSRHLENAAVQSPQQMSAGGLNLPMTAGLCGASGGVSSAHEKSFTCGALTTGIRQRAVEVRSASACLWRLYQAVRGFAWDRRRD